MNRSFGWSALLHVFLMGGILLLWLLGPEGVEPQQRSTVRPMKVVARPELPKMVAGDGSIEASTEPEPLVPPQTPPAPQQQTVQAGKLPNTAVSAGPKKKEAEPRPLLSEPNYPTHQVKPPGQGGPGNDPINSDGEKKGKDRPAIPYYKPTISLEDQTGQHQILVRFEVAVNGTCKVEMLEGTGDIHRDARVLNVLRRWKWLPMRIDGQTYPTVEVLRFYRHDR